MWTQTAALTLALAGHWPGTGTWLLRELRDAGPELAARMAAAIGDPAALAAAADEVLARAGGRFWAGLKLTSTGS